VPLHVADVHTLLEEHAAQIPRERDAVVKGVRLVVDHQDVGGRVELADLLGGVRAGRAVTDDDEAGGMSRQVVVSSLRWSG
jgi:hypothetical protein